MSDLDADYAAQLEVFLDELARLERRLRGLSAAAWRSRSDPVGKCLTAFVDLEAALCGEPAHVLPPIADYAKADAVKVVGGDLWHRLSVSPDVEGLSRALSLLREALATTR